MYLDYRSHVFSLAAVFLALGIGIFIGSLALGDGALLEKQEAILERVESQVAQLRQQARQAENEAQELRIELDEARELNMQIAPLLWEGRLEGQAIALLTLGESRATAPVAETLRQAGAIVMAQWQVAVAPAGWDSEVAPALSVYREDLSWVEYVGEALQGDREAARRLVQLGIMPDAVPTLSEGEDEELYQPPQQVVIAAADHVPDQGRLAAALITSLVRREFRVIGVESSQVSQSLVPVYRSLSLASVDAADLPAGRLALVALLAGAPTGHYGIKETADRLLPEPLTTAGGWHE